MWLPCVKRSGQLPTMTGLSPRPSAAQGTAELDESCAGADEADLHVDKVVALELLEATLGRLRGQPTPCYPAGEQTLLAAAQTLLEAARGGQPTASTDTGTMAPWAGVWRRYLRELGRVAPPATWPTMNAVSQASKERLRGGLYPHPVAGFRARGDYAWVPLADLPAPLNPFRCGHYQQFEQFLARRERQQRRTTWTALLRPLWSTDGSGDHDSHRPARLAGEDFVCWLRDTAAPPCDWHRTGTDWQQAVTWARRCWDESGLIWSEPAVRSWIDRHVPAELRAATTSLFCDPIIWAGPGWHLGNGQTRFLALTGAGVSSVVVSRT